MGLYMIILTILQCSLRPELSQKISCQVPLGHWSHTLNKNLCPWGLNQIYIFVYLYNDSLFQILQFQREKLSPLSRLEPGPLLYALLFNPLRPGIRLIDNMQGDLKHAGISNCKLKLWQNDLEICIKTGQGQCSVTLMMIV